MRNVLAASAFAFLFAVHGGQATAQSGPWLEMRLTSPSFTDGGIIPDKYTQNGANFVSPVLEWTKAPPGTMSFVLLLHDPDVALNKKGDDVTHWLVFNIPGTAHALPEGVATTDHLPDGSIQVKNVTGKVGYLGPGAPATGPYHHYAFELYALDTKLSLGPDASRADVFAAMDGHILGKAADEGRFRKH